VDIMVCAVQVDFSQSAERAVCQQGEADESFGCPHDLSLESDASGITAAAVCHAVLIQGVSLQPALRLVRYCACCHHGPYQDLTLHVPLSRARGIGR
jgi:hypothetical protein